MVAVRVFLALSCDSARVSVFGNRLQIVVVVDTEKKHRREIRLPQRPISLFIFFFLLLSPSVKLGPLLGGMTSSSTSGHTKSTLSKDTFVVNRPKTARKFGVVKS